MEELDFDQDAKNPFEEEIKRLQEERKQREEQLLEVNDAIQNQHKVEQTLDHFGQFLQLTD